MPIQQTDRQNNSWTHGWALLTTIALRHVRQSGKKSYKIYIWMWVEPKIESAPPWLRFYCRKKFLGTACRGTLVAKAQVPQTISASAMHSRCPNKPLMFTGPSGNLFLILLIPSDASQCLPMVVNFHRECISDGKNALWDLGIRFHRNLLNNYVRLLIVRQTDHTKNITRAAVTIKQLFLKVITLIMNINKLPFSALNLVQFQYSTILVHLHLLLEGNKSGNPKKSRKKSLPWNNIHFHFRPKLGPQIF